jgi:hypothetical protein
MRQHLKTVSTAAVVVAVAIAAVSIALAQGGGPAPAPIRPGPGSPATGDKVDAAAGGGLKPCPSDKSANFDTYSLGGTFEDNRRGAPQRVCGMPSASAQAMRSPAVRDNHLGFNYGTCDVPPEDEASCAYPIAIQSFPACERNLSLYQRYPAPDGQSYPYEKTAIRGVPAAIFDSGQRIEIYTGDATVVVWGTSAPTVARAAERLQGTHRGTVVPASKELPAPSAGALDGKLAC